MHIVTFVNISVRIYERQTSNAVGRCGFAAYSPAPLIRGGEAHTGFIPLIYQGGLRRAFQPHRSDIGTQRRGLRLLTLARKERLNEIRAREVS